MDVREFFRKPAGQVTAGLLTALAIVAVIWSYRSNFGQSEAAALSRDRTFICAQTERSFRYQVQPGDTIPVRSPHSGEQTGYPAEACYWTADGQAKPEPTLVLLNEYVGRNEPTFCPDCGRLVVMMNPTPSVMRNPPPTQEQYRAGARPELE
jgi:hypothetical protein